MFLNPKASCKYVKYHDFYCYFTSGHNIKHILDPSVVVVLTFKVI